MIYTMVKINWKYCNMEISTKIYNTILSQKKKTCDHIDKLRKYWSFYQNYKKSLSPEYFKENHFRLF